jgi:peptidoglycan/LPS O-acetylase OafA/YrhL
MTHARRNIHLDAVRGISALVVCAGHTRIILLPGFADLPSHGWLQQLIYFAAGQGHAAVLVFFVLSGYLVGGSVLGSKGSFNWQRYLVNRYVRLWVVLLPALVWTWLVDQQTLALVARSGLAGLREHWHSLPPKVAYSSSFDTFALNLVFQQTVVAPVFGSNGPLWSLANEAWYYLLFPLLVVPLLQQRWALALCLWPLAAGMLAFMPPDMRYLFPVWVLGALLRKLPLGWLTGRWLVGMAAALGFLASLVAYRFLGTSTLSLHAWDMLIGLSFACWAAYLVQNAGGGHTKPWGRVALRLSDFSYSLYLVHMPVLLLFGVLLAPSKKLPGHAADFLTAAGVLAIEVLCAYGFWWVFERQTDRVKALLNRRRTRLVLP